MSKRPFLIGMAIGAALYAAASIWMPPAVDAECSTDAECALLCPADDAECDGGPQP